MAQPLNPALGWTRGPVGRGNALECPKMGYTGAGPRTIKAMFFSEIDIDIFSEVDIDIGFFRG